MEVGARVCNCIWDCVCAWGGLWIPCVADCVIAVEPCVGVCCNKLRDLRRCPPICSMVGEYWGVIIALDQTELDQIKLHLQESPFWANPGRMGYF